MGITESSEGHWESSWRPACFSQPVRSEYPGKPESKNQNSKKQSGDSKSGERTDLFLLAPSEMAQVLAQQSKWENLEMSLHKQCSSRASLGSEVWRALGLPERPPPPETWTKDVIRTEVLGNTCCSRGPRWRGGGVAGCDSYMTITTANNTETNDNT